MDEGYATMTPLEQVLGIHASEEIYDTLNIRQQVIIDLLCAGWSQTEIGMVFNVSQSTINQEVRRIRISLGNTKLRLILESRIAKQQGGGIANRRGIKDLDEE